MTTPIMEQYARIKEGVPDALLFFRLGDFYEMFYEDAKTAARLLGITLTSRFKGEKAVPMAGVPYHSHLGYLHRLLKAGHRVAICEQVQDAAEADGLVQRDVVRVMTPGTLTEGNLLEEKLHNYLAAIHLRGKSAGLAWVELSTGEFRLAELPAASLADELARLDPAECLVPESQSSGDNGAWLGALRNVWRARVTPTADWQFERRAALKSLHGHFGAKDLAGFGVDEKNAGIAAAGAILEYLKATQKTELRHITRLSPDRRDGFLLLDRATRASLELTRTIREGKTEGTLLWVLDRTRTAMGGRMLRDWVTMPLREVAEIRARQDAVGALFDDAGARTALGEALAQVPDLERLTGRVGSGRANARDLLAVRLALECIPRARAAVSGLASDALARLHAALDPMDDLLGEIVAAIADDPPVTLQEGGLFRDGYHAELDGIRRLGREGKDWIAAFQAREAQRTGISSLKVAYNQVFGYYIEITNAHRDKVPPGYERKQTMKNAERYVTPELREWEEQILTADERACALEYRLFLAIRDRVAAAIPRLLHAGTALAQLDALLSLAIAAVEGRYVRPTVDDGRRLSIQEGRHPVLERIIEERFVPNDLELDGSGPRLIVVTGPNMAGKSTYIRQAALLTLMTQMGGFVPAKAAHVGVADRIFTRVGAADELARGHSTFMVEMTETANILNNATDRSLVILDEIGRGTSTFDGVSIAWAVAEHLHDRVGARTLFATHYHELTELALVLPGARNCSVAVREWGEEVVFLHRIVEGGTDKSYGIHVARLAGLPREVVARARVILRGLETCTLDETDRPRFLPHAPDPRTSAQPKQLSLFAPPTDPVVEALRALDVNALTPLQALVTLQELADRARSASPSPGRTPP